jgi:hypothetical protein
MTAQLMEATAAMLVEIGWQMSRAIKGIVAKAAKPRLFQEAKSKIGKNSAMQDRLMCCMSGCMNIKHRNTLVVWRVFSLHDLEKSLHANMLSHRDFFHLSGRIL